MSLKRRILRILGTALVILAFAGYFAFSTFFFSPLESDFEFGLATLVPRDVDFFVAKADLADEFTSFPELAFVAELEATRAGQTFFASPEWSTFRAEYDIEAQLAKLEEALDSAPISVDPLELFGGKSFVIAGYFGGGNLSDSDFVALGRTNWMGKLGQSALSYSSLSPLESQGIAVEDSNAVLALSGGSLTKPLYISRIKDVLVVGTSHALVLGAIDLEQKKGQDSFGQSSRYADYISSLPNRAEGDVEIFVDHDALIKAQVRIGEGPWTGAIPQENPESLVSSFLSRLGQAALVKEFEGVIGFTGGLAVSLHADLSSEKLNSRQKRFYRQKGFNREVTTKVAGMAPEDTGLLAYMQADVADVLRMLLESTEPALQANFQDKVRDVWSYQDGTALFDELDAGLKNRLALIVRPNDYPDEGPEGPPHDDTPTFAWAVVGWVKDAAVLNDFHTKIAANQGRFSIQGHESGQAGVFSHDVAGGLKVFEYWSMFVPGTGHMASVVTDDVFIISNHWRLVESILLTSLGSADYPKLSDKQSFNNMVTYGQSTSSAFVYMDPGKIGETMRAVAFDAASNSVDIDWNLENQRISELVLRSDFGGKREEDLDTGEKASFDVILQVAKDDFQAAFLSEHVGLLSEGYKRTVTYLEAMKAGLFQIALDPKRIDILLRTRIPLEPSQ